MVPKRILTDAQLTGHCGDGRPGDHEQGAAHLHKRNRFVGRQPPEMGHDQSSDHLTGKQNDEEVAGAYLRNGPCDGEHEASAQRARCQKQGVYILQASQNACLPAGQADNDGHDGTDGPEDRVRYTRVGHDFTYPCIHRKVDRNDDAERYHENKKREFHDVRYLLVGRGRYAGKRFEEITALGRSSRDRSKSTPMRVLRRIVLIKSLH